MIVSSSRTYSPRKGRQSSGAGRGFGVLSDCCCSNSNKTEVIAAERFVFLYRNCTQHFESSSKRAVQNFILTRDAEAHVIVVSVAVGKRAARHARHAFVLSTSR